MQLISLFSGIGGFELAAEWMGWDVIASCEINPFGQRVLKHYWPEAYHHDDIHTLNYETLKTQSRWDSTRPTILTGGFPCQPYSTAGKRRGKEVDRHLWPEMLRVIREIRPNYIVGENVLGLVSWDAGLVFDEVHSDLEAEGYEVQAVVIPAAAVNAPHGRDRIWFCARLVTDTNFARCKDWDEQYKRKSTQNAKRFDSISGCSIGPTPDTDVNRCSSQGESIQTERIRSRNDGKSEEWGEQTKRTDGLPRLQRDASDTNSDGQQRCDSEYENQPSEGGEYAQRDIEQDNFEYSKSIGQKYALENQELERGRFRQSNKRNAWDSFPSVSPICSRNDGLSTKLDGITFSKWRNESIKAAGNAIVPQVAYSIFKAIIQCENKE